MTLHRGLHAVPSAPQELVLAARAGAAVTSASAARELGLWIPPGGRLHLALNAGASAPKGVDGACLHWSHRVPAARTLPDRVAPLDLVLEHALRCLPAELAIAMIDSGLRSRQLSKGRLGDIARRLPEHLRPLLDRVDGRSDSGVESVGRLRVQAAGLPFVFHPVLAGIGEVDLLIAGVLIVEIDGREFHAGDEAFARDRRRDREAALRGFRVLRFTYRQVMDEWPACLAAILRALDGAVYR